MIESGSLNRLIDATPQMKLGIGSVGEVWRAVSGERAVAIKVINQPYSEPQRRSIETEIQTLNRLRHPAIPEMYDFDLVGERPCIVMEYIDGESFQQIIARRTLWTIPILRRLSILAEIADAAEYLHTQGLIHRDIKPANIIGIDAPHLIDYGIAAEMGSENASAGTPFYRYPGDQKVGIAHDQFGFALTAYEFLFGRHAIFSSQDGSLPRDVLKMTTQERLRAGTWRVPSRIPAHELPYDLRGVDLAQLDTIFTRALDWDAVEPTGLMGLVEALTTAIATPENLPFIDRMPEMAAFWMSDTPDAEGEDEGTVHADAIGRARSRRVGMGIAIGIGIVIFLMIVLQNPIQ